MPACTQTATSRHSNAHCSTAAVDAVSHWLLQLDLQDNHPSLTGRGHSCELPTTAAYCQVSDPSLDTSQTPIPTQKAKACQGQSLGSHHQRQHAYGTRRHQQEAGAQQ
jgi:hypothetical protein